MDMVTLLPADIYQVVNKSLLNENDKLVLSMLYMPIIGNTAITLYNTLYNELKANNFISNELTHHHLMTNLGDNLNNIKEARIKLEGIGLMKTYYMKGSINFYVYELYSPLSVHEFFSHPIFNMVFYNNVGKDEYVRIKDYFRVPLVDLNGYTDITSPFDMTFKSRSYSNFELEDSDNIVKKTKMPLSYEMVFDFDTLVSSMPKGLVNPKFLTKSIKDLIGHLSFLYNVDSITMADLVKVSLNEKGLVDRELLKTNVRRMYEFNNNGRLPSLVYKNQPMHLRSFNSDDSVIGRMINVFETTKPYDFLKDKYKGVRPSEKDMRILEMLIVDFQFSPAVCNVLVDYILKTQDNRLVKNYVEAVAGDWKKANLETAKDAMMYAINVRKKIKDTKENKDKVKTSRKEEIVPEWFDQKQVKESMDDKTKNELEVFLKEFV